LKLKFVILPVFVKIFETVEIDGIFPAQVEYFASEIAGTVEIVDFALDGLADVAFPYC
jgi:hypothetical protein